MKKFRFTVLLLLVVALQSKAQKSCFADYTAYTDTTLTAKFYDSSTYSTGTREYFKWTFGDSTASDTSKNPTHTYKKAGTYDVCETIWDSLKKCTTTHCYYITVGKSQKSCFADYISYTDTTLTARFYDSSSYASGMREYFKWTFGDSTSSDTSKNPVHTFKKAGTYDVCETIWDSLKKCTTTHCYYITVGKAQKSCFANYTAYTDTTLTAKFYDSSTYSTGTREYFKWTFGDSTASDTSKNPTHTYKKAGTYDVCETIWDSLKKCTTTHCYYITVGISPSKCNAMFTVDSIDSLKKIIYITNRSTGGASYVWSFGDGDSTTLSAPTHTYSSAGRYSLCLYLNCSGSYSYFCDTINGASTHIRSGVGYTIKIRQSSSAGINNMPMSSIALNVYPNPVNNTLNVTLPDNVTNGTLSVKNLLGQELITKEISARTSTLNMNTTAPGMYLIQMQTTNGTFTTKIIKQ